MDGFRSVVASRRSVETVIAISRYCGQRLVAN
jgi:hypothetical protein